MAFIGFQWNRVIFPWLPLVIHSGPPADRPGGPSDLTDPTDLLIPAGPSGSHTGITKEYRRGSKTNFYDSVFGHLGTLLSLQSTKPCSRMAFSRFFVHNRHWNRPFWCPNGHFIAIFHGISRWFFQGFQCKIDLDRRVSRFRAHLSFCS